MTATEPSRPAKPPAPRVDLIWCAPKLADAIRGWLQHPQPPQGDRHV